jgi:hypothetical protein
VPSNIILLCIEVLVCIYISVPVQSGRETTQGLAVCPGWRRQRNPKTLDSPPRGTPNRLGQVSRRRWFRTHGPMLQHIFQQNILKVTVKKREYSQLRFHHMVSNSATSSSVEMKL